MNKVLILLLIIVALLYYKTLKYVNHTDDTIYDVLHNKLPFIEHQELIDGFPIIITIYLIYVLYKTKKFYLIKDYTSILFMLFSIRLLLNNVTLIPVIKSKKQDKEYMKKRCSNKLNITGGCNDYIFSGHMTVTMLSVLFIMLAKQKVDVSLILYSMMSALMIICTHSHYTVDVILAIVITLLTFSSYFLCTDNDKCSNYFSLN
jgi:hypothetical protein